MIDLRNQQVKVCCCVAYQGDSIQMVDLIPYSTNGYLIFFGFCNFFDFLFWQFRLPNPSFLTPVWPVLLVLLDFCEFKQR